MSVYNRAGSVIGETMSASTVKPLNGLRLSLLGDSISTYRGQQPEGNHYYYNGSRAGVTSVDKMWWKILCNETGMTQLVIDAWSGTGISHLDDEDHTNRTEMSSDLRCGRLHSGSTKPDIIIIAGGVNDYSYADSAKNEPLAWDGTTTPVITNSFTECYACMINKLQTNYPNALIVCLSTWFTMRGTLSNGVYTHTSRGTVYTQKDYDDKIEFVANVKTIPYIKVNDIGFNTTNMYPTFAEDSATHPAHVNSKGQCIMGYYMAKALPPIAKAWGKGS